ncbi:hypothetical protein L3476_16020 [Paenibacillus thiaminolyticus]|uniref:hypothetical protein n=1 Tax=Paenibacillus thiaminolyticus TaxID=49283 RepID=UPI00234FF384|nr:hypothetical protein [Paenibacillus thiaminolyticus]WCR24889.1 hypothetical protein L3476_16020 [Paenibacillus thiaminolyticus]
MNKKVISLFIMIFLVVIPTSVFAKDYTIEQYDMSKDQILDKFTTILESYEVNVPFSPQDEQFVRKYILSKNAGIQTLTTEDRQFFQGQSETYALTGYVDYEHNALGKNEWDFYMTAWDTTDTKRDIKAEVTVDVLGIINISEGKIGKIFNKTVSQSSNGKQVSVNLKKSASFTGWPIMIYYYPKATFDGTEVRGEFRN